MMKKSSRYYLLTGIILSMIGIMCLLGYMVTVTLEKKEQPQDDIQYVSYEVLTDNAMPVTKEEQEETSTVTRPYNNTEVKVGKSYYDYQGEEQTQEDSIIYYEDTYIQNTGTDYINNETFEVVSIADGTVVSVTKNDITGETIKIKHDNNLISVYQSVKDIMVKENDQVVRGQIIATSGTNNIGSDLGNHLHFELYEDNILVDPEKYFAENEGN